MSGLNPFPVISNRFAMYSKQFVRIVCVHAHVGMHICARIHMLGVGVTRFHGEWLENRKDFHHLSFSRKICHCEVKLMYVTVKQKEVFNHSYVDRDYNVVSVQWEVHLQGQIYMSMKNYIKSWKVRSGMVATLWHSGACVTGPWAGRPDSGLSALRTHKLIRGLTSMRELELKPGGNLRWELKMLCRYWGLVSSDMTTFESTEKE